ncbi:hypothetical protein Egran_01846 [Elaphomyces granulatus]|uniref:Uncharacterized protein n=1 Tax=Elaphomyces granulatus TaxID=519963 RepID=A0A232M221_9EURO|nr:hypothetical protein Egran_01846 [Elaphomyces granulatus]
MTDVDEENRISFDPRENEAIEFRRRLNGNSEVITHALSDDNIDDFLSHEGNFAMQQPETIAGAVTLIFCQPPRNLSGGLNILFTPEILSVSWTERAFNAIIERHQFPKDILAVLQKRGSSAGWCSRYIKFEPSGKAAIISFVLMVRLTGSYASLLAISHDMSARRTVAFVIRARKDEHDLIKGTLQRNRHLLGHPLLVPALLVGISMSSNFGRVQILQVELANVERSTGQHDWQNIPVADAPRHDGELSRRGHSAKIAVAVASRLVDAVRCLFTLCQETSSQFQIDISQSCLQNRLVGFDFDQLLFNLQYQLHLRQADIEFLQQRADNQVSAIYSRLSQRDNMLSASIARESKKISESTLRDSSDLTCITALTALLLPATFTATLFAIPSLGGLPFWAYWAIAIPVTVTFFGAWVLWSLWRQHRSIKDKRLDNGYYTGHS